MANSRTNHWLFAAPDNNGLAHVADNNENRSLGKLPSISKAGYQNNELRRKEFRLSIQEKNIVDIAFNYNVHDLLIVRDRSGEVFHFGDDYKGGAEERKITEHDNEANRFAAMNQMVCVAFKPMPRGGYYYYFQAANGELLITDFNGADRKTISLPKIIQSAPIVRGVCFLTESGQVYRVFSDGKLLELQMPEKATVKQIAADEQCLLALSDSGEVFGSDNIDTHIGHPRFKKIPNFEKEKIKQVYMTIEGSCFLTESGHVYLGGLARRNILQHKEVPFDGTSYCTPQRIEGLDGVLQVAVNYNLVYFLKQTGELYTCGRKHDAALGFSKNEKWFTSPTLVPMFAERSALHRINITKHSALTLDEIIDESLDTQEPSHYQFKRLLLQVMSDTDLLNEVLVRSSPEAKQFVALILAVKASHEMPEVDAEKCQRMHMCIDAYISACKAVSSDNTDKNLMGALDALCERLKAQPATETYVSKTKML